MGSYLIYRVDKGLGVVFGETNDNLDLIGIREDGRYQKSAIVRGKLVADQTFPGGKVASHKNAVKLTGRQRLE